MSDNNINPEQQDLDLDSKKKKQGQMLLIILVAAACVTVGVIFFANSYKKNKTADNSDLENIMPQEAKNKVKKEDGKYGKYQSERRKIADQNYNANLDEITGVEDQYTRRSNEHLTEQDFKEVQQAAPPAPVETTARRNLNSKETMNKANQRNIRNAQRQIAYDANPSTPMFKKSKEELREERMAELERENNAKLTESVLKGLEKAQNNQNSQNGQNIQNINPYANPTPGQIAKNRSVPGAVNSDNALVVNTDDNTIAKATPTGFYSQSKSLEAEHMNKYSYIPAVVHGNGDGVKVQNGSNIKLRLLAETYINIGGQKTVLPRNSLLNGMIRITNDRVNIVISSVRLNNNVVPVKMIAYDLDGTQGLYIPNLMDKNLLARELAEAGSRPMQGSVWTQGSIQQQVGTQVATEAAKSLIQGTSQYARRKAQIVRVTIKPNYKVLLTAGSLENTEDSESISNY